MPGRRASPFRGGPLRPPPDPAALAAQLWEAGFLAADEEAQDLLACAGDDGARLSAMLARRLTGEPLAWITGSTTFCGLAIRVDAGVYVPRAQSEALAWRALERLGPDGCAIDVCTGSGAIAKTLAVGRPKARVVACDIDPRAVACAVGNDVESYCGDLFDPLPRSLRGSVDVVVGVVPYVPTPAMAFLQRDTLAFESPRSYDGGADGTRILGRAAHDSRHFLRPGGALLLELGGDQHELLSAQLDALGYTGIIVLRDEDGDVRGLEATYR